MSVWLVLLAQLAASAEPDAAVPSRSLPITLPGLLTGCDAQGGADDIVVCGGRRDRFRLPLPIDRAAPSDGRVRGEAANPVAAITPTGSCGLFTGQRACGEAEAARYGYGAGRDPITVLTKLGKRLLDADGDIGESTKLP